MIKPLELAIGLRYIRAKRRNHFISFITLFSIIGFALGVGAIIIVLSVMNGFEKEVRSRILEMVSHLTVTSFENRIDNWSDTVMQLKERPEVTGAAPYIEGQGMLINGKNVNGSLIRGILPDMEPDVSNISGVMEEGALTDLHPGQFEVVLGRDLARILRVRVGDKVTIVTPSANVTPAGIAPRMKRFKVVGIFYVGHSIYDSALAVIHLQDAQKLFRMNSAVTGVRAKLKDLFDAPRVGFELQKNELNQYWVRDWGSVQSNWFRAVKIEKRMMFIILFIIVIVAAFNVVSTLVMAVTDKESDIAILRTLGSTPGSIMKIFMIQGTLIGTVGTICGVLLGVIVSLNLDVIVPFIEELLGIHILDSTVYYITEFPSDLHVEDVWLIAIVSFISGIVSTLYPSWRASRTQPAEALRYE